MFGKTLTLALVISASAAQQVMHLIESSSLAEALTEELPQFDAPTDRQCIVFQDSNYSGNSLTFELSSSSTRHQWDLVQEHWNDKISSWWCGKNVCLELWNNQVYDGNGVSACGAVKNPQTGNNDRATTLIMTQYDPVYDKGALTLFQDANCRGQSGYFYAGTQQNVPVYYNTNDMRAHYMGNDEVSSLLIPFNVKVTLYSDDGWQGKKADINPDGWVNMVTQEMECINIDQSPYSLQDQTSSLKVTKERDITSVFGYWSLVISSSAPIATRVTEQYVRTNTTQQTNEVDQTFSYQLEFGCEFESETLNEEYHIQTIEMTEQTEQYTVGIQFDFTCPDVQADHPGASLWQWVVASSMDSYPMAKALNHATTCTYGVGWNVAPSCPYPACLDADCIECANYTN